MEWLRHTAAWFPARVKIAGRELAPATLGHWRLLECADSPFVTGGTAGVRDCALALAVLSRPWRKARRMLASPLRRSLALVRRVPADAAIEIEAYLSECWWMPARFEEAGGGKSGKARPAVPFSVRLAAVAVRENWLSMLPDRCETVWDAPLPQLLLASAAVSEMNGAEFETAGEAEAVEAQMADVQKGQTVSLTDS